MVCACAYVCVVSSLYPVYFSSPDTLRLPVHNTGHPVSTDPYTPGVSRPVKSRSYQYNGRTDSTHRCWYECYKRSQYTEYNAKPAFLSRINFLRQSMILANHLDHLRRPELFFYSFSHWAPEPGWCRPNVWWELRSRHPQILLHALARLRVRDERRFEGHLRSPGKSRVANV